MPRQASTAIENNFKQGLITEATGLNFPENACTATFDCIFNMDGTVERRLGFDFENGYSTKTINRNDAVVSTFLWKNVSGDGDVTLFVAQIGETIYFWDTSETVLSNGALSTTVDVTDFLASGAPSPGIVECQFSSSDKYLIVTHPYCDPFRISYDVSTQTATGTAIILKIRDFEGDAADTETIDSRPTATLGSLDVNHYYNLLNQGWTVTNLTAWDTAQTTMPSNADVQWFFKNSSEDFDFSNASIARQTIGNTPAAKGHYILTLSLQDRDAISGLSGTTDTTTSYFRPSTSAFFAGRAFYAGINYLGFNTDIYFTQIIERDEQYAFCYQLNDPTNEDNSDLLPSDGGVIRIKEAGTVYKIVAIAGALVVFANNGVWLITGSVGVGFTANDYTVQKISSISTISASSFVDVAGYPAWCNEEGIYILTPAENTAVGASVGVKSLTAATIKTAYSAISKGAKLQAVGYFHTLDGVIQWLFRSSDAGTPSEEHEYDFILNYNVLTNSFYPWIISDGTPTINGVVVLEGTSGLLTQSNVVDDTPDNVIDDSTNQVVVFTFQTAGGESEPKFRYLMSYPDAGSHKVTFGGADNLNYVDWQSFDDVGVDYTSFFISGYKLRGHALMKWQPTWVNIYSDTSEPTSYNFTGAWDYSVFDLSRFSNTSTITHNATDYAFGTKRIKVRGHGKALQFLVYSVPTQPFRIIGWATFDTANPIP